MCICCFPQKVAGLELREQELREEVVQANQLRKQQLVELGLLREEEKQKMQRDQEMEVQEEILDFYIQGKNQEILHVVVAVIIIVYMWIF